MLLSSRRSPPDYELGNMIVVNQETTQATENLHAKEPDTLTHCRLSEIMIVFDTDKKVFTVAKMLLTPQMPQDLEPT